MNIKEIQDIINFIKKTDLDDVSIETENYKIRVKKNNAEVTQLKDKKKIPVEIENDETKLTKESEIETNYITIKSPMIGTLYRSPNPESEPYINEGDTINAGQTICIIEAMKLFNEIESEISGKIIKVLVDDATPIEFGQDLFLIDPS